MIFRVHAHVEPAIRFGMFARSYTRFAVRPQLQRAECNAGAAHGRVDHVCDNGRSGWHLPCPLTIEHKLAHGVAHNANRAFRTGASRLLESLSPALWKP